MKIPFAAILLGAAFAFGAPDSVAVVPSRVDSLQIQLQKLIPDSVQLPQLSLRQADLRDALIAMGIQKGVNLVVDPAITGTLTLNLRKIGLRDAIQLIARENGLLLEPLPGALKIARPPAPPPAPPQDPPCKVDMQGGLLTVDIQGAPLPVVARKLSEATGVNVLVEGVASSPVVLFLQKMPLQQVLTAIADAQNLQLREKNKIWVFSVPPVVRGLDGVGAAGAGAFRLSVEDSLVSLEARQVPFQDVLNAVSQRMGGNLVVLGTPTGNATLKLNKVSWEQVFDLLFSGTEYTWWKRDGAWFVGPSTSPGVTNSELIPLKHLKAEEALDMVPSSIQRNVQLKVMKSHNGIVVLGSKESIEGVRQFLQKIDYSVPQILIEALVVDVDVDKVRDIGVKAFFGKSNAGSNSRSVYPGIEQVFHVNGENGGPPEIPGLRDVVRLPSDFFVKIRAMEQEKILKIRSRPQISTLNGSEATITVGQTQYFLLKTETAIPQTSATTTQTTQRFEKIEANVTLTVTPFVTGDKEITCDIVPDFSEPEGAFDANTPPTINRRILKSKVRLRDGETIVLGGLVKESINSIREQVPLLGSIPILGELFKNRNTTRSRSQLMIFVTPHIYYGSESQVDAEAVIKRNEE